jgi:hypothetical protein
VTNKFISVLDKVGAIGKDIWKVAEPIIVHDVIPVAEAVEPELAILFPVLGPLWNISETLIKNAEAAANAAGAQKAGTQKSALVIASLLPYAIQDAQKLGIIPPTTAQMQSWINIVVLGLKTFGAL